MTRSLFHILYAGLSARGFTKWLPDEAHLKIMYKSYMGIQLNTSAPSTFNEKLQWLKLHDHNPLYNTLVDKYAAKIWAAERIGWKHIVPTLAAWERAEDIDISGLPERFVLKTNHDCGGVAVCRDRATFDLGAAKKKLAKHLRRNYFWGGREWPYKDVRPLVFAEQYLDPGEGGSESAPTDYKLMCFGGEFRCAFTCTGRARGDLRVDFFDPAWERLPFTRHYPNADVPPTAPTCLPQMARMAEELSAGIPFLRVDFYEVGGLPYLGELTLYPGSGFEEFDPPEWDLELGSWIDLGLVEAEACGI